MVDTRMSAPLRKMEGRAVENAGVCCLTEGRTWPTAIGLATANVALIFARRPVEMQDRDD